MPNAEDAALPTPCDSALRLARRFSRALLLALAAAHALAAAWAESMNPDGVSYLDLGDAIWSGDRTASLNTTWSPLYAALIAGAVRAVDPAPRFEFAVVHGVNFVLFALALACFERLWSELDHARLRWDRDAGCTGFARWQWHAVGYALFAWASLAMIEVWAVTPDLGVASATFLASALLVRIACGRGTRRTHAALGAVLGVGYLAKAILFPMGLVVLAAAAFAGGPLRHTARRLVPALAVFALFAGPWIGALSAAKGRLTFSDVGSYTYLKHVLGVPVPHWRPGVVDDLGRPRDPVRLALAEPEVWEFATPVAGTYPLAFDPYHWVEGLEGRPAPRAQLSAVLSNLGVYFDLYAHRLGGAVALVLALLGLRAAPPSRAVVALLAVSGVAHGAYALVYAEARYVAPFTVIGAGALLAWIRLPRFESERRLLGVSAGLLLALLGAEIAAYELSGLNALTGWVGPTEWRPPSMSEPRGRRVRPSEIASALAEAGLAPGDRVGVVGYAYDAYWARLARLRIVAEVTPEGAAAFAALSGDRRAAAHAAFARSGARAVVVEPGTFDVPSGFAPLRDSHYGLLWLEPPPRAGIAR